LILSFPGAELFKPNSELPRKAGRAMIHLRNGILLGGILLCAASLPAQEQPLGDVVKAQKEAKARTTPSKVIQEEQLAEMRERNHVGGPGTECDPSCQATVRTAMEDKAKKMTDADWAEALADGRGDLETDAEWQGLFPEIQREVCLTSAERARDPERSQAAGQRIASKMLRETKEAMHGLSLAVDPDSNPATRERITRELRGKAVKLQIMKLVVDRAKQSCGAR
jgi:hypothetical protein